MTHHLHPLLRKTIDETFYLSYTVILCYIARMAYYLQVHTTSLTQSMILFPIQLVRFDGTNDTPCAFYTIYLAKRLKERIKMK